MSFFDTYIKIPETETPGYRTLRKTCDAIIVGSIVASLVIHPIGYQKIEDSLSSPARALRQLYGVEPAFEAIQRLAERN